MIKVVIAEDNLFLAHSLINKLGLFPDFKVKYHALNGEDLMAKLNLDANVDIILMDIQMPEVNGIVATHEISKKYPHIKIIMLTILDSEQTILEAIRAGAIGYLLKESSPQMIHDSIFELIEGGAPMSPSIARKALKIMRNPTMGTVEKIDFKLSSREKNVLQHLSKGLNYNQIASNLIISPNTVRRHIEKIYKKMDVHNKVEAIEKAHKHGLLD